MTRTASLPEDQAVAGRSVGYTKAPGVSEWARTPTRCRTGAPAGGGYSTVGDLARLAHALTSHTLLGPRYTQMLITRKVSSGYAYGFDDARDSRGNGWRAPEAAHRA